MCAAKMLKSLSFLSVSMAPGFSNESNGKSMKTRKKRKPKKSDILTRLSFLESSDAAASEAKSKEDAELERITEIASGQWHD